MRFDDGTLKLAARLALAVGALAISVSTAPGVALGENGLHTGENGGRVAASTLAAAVVRADAATGLARPYGGRAIDVTTYHYDNGRTGWNSRETDLTPASVASGRFGLLKILAVDGGVWAQPLLVSGYAMADRTTHDVLIVATTANSVYAFDAGSYDLLWRVNFGPPQTEQSVLCKGRTIGINGTPAIGPGAPGKQIIYLVTRSQPASGVYRTQIRALDLGSGRDIRRPAAVTATETLSNGKVVSFDPFLQFNRTGLALKDRTLYFGVGANCEEAADLTTGWMFRFDASLLSKQVYPLIQQQVTGKLLGGVWMSGFAPAIDGAGNVFVVTGDGSTTFQNPRNWSNSVLKMSPGLSAVRDYFTPSNYGVLDLTDGDFGAGGVMLLPPLPTGSTTPHKLAVAMGKNPVIYLLDQTALGGFSPTNSGAVQALPVGLGPQEGGVWGGPAYYKGPAGPTIYYQVKNDVLKAYHLSFAGKPTLFLAARGVSPVISNSASPTVSSNGAHADTGIVWVVKRTTPTTLEAYDAVKLGAPLYRSSAGKLSGLAPSAMVANGRVYVTGYGTVHVFGLVN